MGLRSLPSRFDVIAYHPYRHGPFICINNLQKSGENCFLSKPLVVYCLGNLYCTADRTIDYLRIEGDITVEIEWPTTAVGLRRIVRCPYAYDRPSYAHRDCTLQLADRSPTWSDSTVNDCPDPPFSQAVEILLRFVVSVYTYIFIRSKKAVELYNVLCGRPP